MKSLMLKLLTSLVLSSSLLFGADVSADLDKKIMAFLTKAIAPNENYKLEKMTILKKEEMKELQGWKVYFVRVDLALTKQEGKKVSINDILFTDGKTVSKDLLDIASGRSYKAGLSLDIDAKAYTKEHLLAGNFNAPNKLVIFSDPMCPFCMDFVPEVIRDVEKNPETFALFYYHLPLSIHPAASGLIRAMLVAEEKGEKDVVKRVYDEVFDLKVADDVQILKAFNAALKTTITPSEIVQDHIVKRMKDDQEYAANLMVNGTPTIFVNGKKDEEKTSYRKLIKEKK